MFSITRRLVRFAVPVLVALALAVAPPAPAEAFTGFEGAYRTNGAKCWFNEIEVNPPEIFAFDATAAVDYQDVSWTSELWRLDEATGTWVLDLEFGEWYPRQVSDGSDGLTLMIIGGYQSFTINVPGVYKMAVRISWEPTAAAPAGEAYVWSGDHYHPLLSYMFGASAIATEACRF